MAAICTLSLHDALPISLSENSRRMLDHGIARGAEALKAAGAHEVAFNPLLRDAMVEDRKSTRLNSSHVAISYAVSCLKKKKPFYRDTPNAAAPQPMFLY